MDTKKILFVYGQLGRGGISEVLTNLIKCTDPLKYSMTLVSYMRDDNEIFNLPVDYRDLNLPMTSGPKQIFYFILRTLRLKKIIDEIKPDLVLSAFNRVNINTALAVKIAKFKPKFVPSEHTSLSVELGIVNEKNFRKQKQYPDKSFLHNILHNLANRVLAFLIKRLYPAADKIITVSDGIKNELVSNFNIDPYKINVIYNPVDFHRIRRLMNEEITEHVWFGENVPIIITAGRLAKQKAYDVLIEAFARVKKEIECRLVFLGEGEYFEILKTKTGKLGLNDSILFLGYRNNPFKFISRAEVFALTSIYEGFPLVILESMVCGTPVLSTDCPTGPSEIINSGENGVLVPVNDVDAIAEELKKMIKDHDYSAEIRRNAEISVQKFSPEKCYQQYEKVFEELC